MYDVIIIGGGPAGLTSAIYTRRALLKTLVIEKENFGGQIFNSLEVENYPGFKNISGKDLSNSMLEQAESLGTEIVRGNVTNISKNNDIFNVMVNNTNYQSKALIYATGASPRKLGVPMEDEFIGLGVSYCATCDGNFFKGKKVAVIGGGTNALDDALYLSNLAKEVYLIHRRDEFRAEKIKVEKINEKENIKLVLNANVKKINGNGKVEGLTVIYNDNKEEDIEVDGVFIIIGRNPNTELVKDLIELDNSGYIIATEKLETNIPGLFVAGDVRAKEVRQLTTATNDGTIASVSVIDYLNS